MNHHDHHATKQCNKWHDDGLDFKSTGYYFFPVCMPITHIFYYMPHTSQKKKD